jgi:hypothetical protein
MTRPHLAVNSPARTEEAAMRIAIVTTLALLVVVMTGCATGGVPGLSSLGNEVNVTPARGQTAEQLRLDDQACEQWTRSTKGPSEPLPAAELRYSACALSRGYSVRPWSHRIAAADPAPDLAGVVADWQACGMKRGLYDAGSLVLLGGIEAGMTESRREQAIACLKQRGYAVDAEPDARVESIREK